MTMSQPIEMLPRKRLPSGRHRLRRGAVLPLFALLFPVLLILAGFAINLAYMQLTKLEIQVATDASVRAAGRSLSVLQDTYQAQAQAQRVAALNLVGGRPFGTENSSFTMEFGKSQLTPSGRLAFEQSTIAPGGFGVYDVTAVRLVSVAQVPMLMRVAPVFSNDTTISRMATAMQADRDICLVLDRSGSMEIYENEQELIQALDALVASATITSLERDLALNNLIFTDTMLANFDGKLLAYAASVGPYLRGEIRAPLHSRWSVLEESLDLFISILSQTAQAERVSIASFSDAGQVNLFLTDNEFDMAAAYRSLRPSGFTAIGAGMNSGIATLQSTAGARPFAAKTMIVLTDGINNQFPDPISAAHNLMNANKMVIHSVTFTPDADVHTMQQVAEIGNGKHYHANIPSELEDAFRELALDLPVVIIE